MKARKLHMKENGGYYLLLLFFGLLNYWPLSLRMFSLKNDALIYFLPYRYHVSEAIQHGHFPFWSPYLYTGLPLHADIQSGVWNPVVMFISLFTSYNMTVLEWELLLYVFIGGAGFFRLCGYFDFDKKISLLLAASYMASGFMIDSSAFIPWITSAGWLPFVFLYFLRVLEQSHWRNLLLLGISTALLFLSGYMSFFIITAYILLIIFLVHTAVMLKRGDRARAFSVCLQMGAAAIICLIICSPALVSYIGFFPYYQRGAGVELHRAQSNPFSLVNLVSFLFPPASYQLHTGNDISSRNAFAGLFPLLLAVYACRFRLTRVQKIIVIITLSCFLFSLGSATPVRAFFYHAFPLMDTFRHPGTVRLYTIIGLLLMAGFGYKNLQGERDKRSFRNLTRAAGLLILVTVLYFVVFTPALSHLGKSFSQLRPDSKAIKRFLDSSTFEGWMVISGFVQLTFLALPVRKRLTILIPAGLLNLVVFSALCMPFTMVSQYRTEQADRYVHSHPPGFPANLAWERVADPRVKQDWNSLGYEAFYSKRISIQDQLNNPTINKAYEAMLADTGLRRSISGNRFAYLSGKGNIALAGFGPNAFRFRVSASSAVDLHLTQQYHHHWKAFIDDQPAVISKDALAFMKISVPAGSHTIRFVYHPSAIVVLSFVSLAVLLGCLILLIYFRCKQ
ncbi:MAG TPA: hypothetical protein VFR58_06065 [Flavisolibacter sp.]|nr:hypothetical protein [Flavisolibacter sp.]